jgi:hypothetical protein
VGSGEFEKQRQKQIPFRNDRQKGKGNSKKGKGNSKRSKGNSKINGKGNGRSNGNIPFRRMVTLRKAG